MGIVLGTNRYGKAETRVFRIVRDTERHVIRDLNVSTSLSGDFAAAHVDGDQAHVLPTDTQKNTVFAFAKSVGIGEIEEFGLALARHFVDDVAPVTGADVRIDEHGWERIADRDHGFCRRGPDVRTTDVVVAPEGSSVVSGMRDLVVLKSTGSEFAGFLVDEYTTLAATHDRVLATSLTVRWTYAEGDGHDWARRTTRCAGRSSSGSSTCTPWPCSSRCGRWVARSSRPCRRSPRSSWSPRTSTTSPSTSGPSASATTARSST